MKSVCLCVGEMEEERERESETVRKLVVAFLVKGWHLVKVDDLIHLFC